MQALQSSLGNAGFARLAAAEPPGALLSLRPSVAAEADALLQPAAALQRAPGGGEASEKAPRAEELIASKWPQLVGVLDAKQIKTVQKYLDWRVHTRGVIEDVAEFEKRAREKYRREGIESYQYLSEYHEQRERVESKFREPPEVTTIEVDTSKLIDPGILREQDWNIDAERQFRERWVLRLASKPTIFDLMGRGTHPIEDVFAGVYWNGVWLPTEGGLITWEKLHDPRNGPLGNTVWHDYYESVEGSPVARAAKEQSKELRLWMEKAESDFEFERERKREFPGVSAVAEFFSSDIDWEAAARFLPPGKKLDDMNLFEKMEFLGSLKPEQLERASAVLPSFDDWLKVYGHTRSIETAVIGGQYEAALLTIPIVADEIQEFIRKVFAYRRRTLEGAATVIKGLEAVKVGCKVVLTIGGGVAGRAYGMLGIAGGSAAGAGGAEMAFEAASQVGQGRFDPGAILWKGGKEAVVTFITSLIGGALGSKFQAMLGNRLTFVTNDSVRTFLIGRLADAGSGVLSTPIEVVLEGMIEGNWPKSMDELLEKVASNAVQEIVLGGALDIITHEPNLKGKAWDALVGRPDVTGTGGRELPPGSQHALPPGSAGDPATAGKQATDAAHAQTDASSAPQASAGVLETPRGRVASTRIVSETATLVSIDRTAPVGKQHKGATAGAGGGLGVFDARVRLPSGQEVDVKVKILSKKRHADVFAREVEGAKAAAVATDRAPAFFGVVDIPPDPRFADGLGFAMETVPGGFMESYAKPGTPEFAEAEALTKASIDALSPQTMADIKNYGDQLWNLGYFAKGDAQGLVDPQGRWRPIDFSSVARQPDPPAPTGDPVQDLLAKDAYDKKLAELKADHDRVIEGVVEEHKNVMEDRDAKRGRVP
ncbi:MAG TPA: hypothetical protein VNN10_14955 [Dehalococcoidia bacterium]|nr:hypothetical protein [Dehalococcoidia bacterium]